MMNRVEDLVGSTSAETSPENPSELLKKAMGNGAWRSTLLERFGEDIRDEIARAMVPKYTIIQ
jgi:hypothetical protein